MKKRNTIQVPSEIKL